MKYLVIALSGLGLLAACSPKTTEIMEVPDSTEIEVTAPDGDMPKADIAEGKVVFLTNCLGCHYGNGPGSAEDLDNYSKAQIDAILPKMLKNAELNQAQTRQVSAYIYWEIEN